MPTTAIPREGRVLGLDWGANRIGLAITDPTQLIASPLEVLRRRAGKRLPLGAFLTIVEREEPVGIVVGIPFDDQGREGASAMAAREMAEQFGARSGLPLDFIDESFSTSESHARLIERGISPASRDAMIDAMAAAVVLERWLASRVVRVENHEP
jgi:putative Holliday junction resolvase